MIKNLIVILKQNKAKDICSEVHCSMVTSCRDCPFDNEKSLAETVEQLEKLTEVKDNG